MGANNESNLQSKAAVAADALSRSSTCLHSQKNASGLIAAAVHVLSFFLSTANVPYPSGCTFPFASTLKQCRQLGVTCLCCALWVQNIVATAGSGTPWLLPLLLPLLIGEKDQLTEDAEEQKIAPKNAKGHNLLTEEHTPCRRRRCCCCCCWFCCIVLLIEEKGLLSRRVLRDTTCSYRGAPTDAAVGTAATAAATTFFTL
mmetsp:Transcript_12321/g.33608  ORF Transcript_12321/g.33608 Transcript_12321/m.33608 type:complete len:201 (+) Transcript_12321:258-860(+)|eukprot:1147552-Pelagomonas_calceolata.AAC.2